MPKHLSGGKFTHAHTTVTDAAYEVAREAAKLSEVTKIALGVIQRANGGRFSMKFVPMNGGWKIRVRGSASVQDLFVYSTDPERTKSNLEVVFDR